MGQFFDLISEAIDAAKQPKEAASAIYHGIMKRGEAALKDPVAVGEALYAHYDLNLSMYFSFVLYLGLATNYLTRLGGLLNGNNGFIAFLLLPLLTVFVQLLVVWFIGPFMDRLGYRIFGVRVSLERAREVAFAAGLPSVAPIMVAVLFGIPVIGAFIPALQLLGLLIFPLAIFLAVQSFRVRKHVLGESYVVAICGPLLVWFVVGFLLVAPISFMLIASASNHTPGM